MCDFSGTNDPSDQTILQALSYDQTIPERTL